MLSTESSENSYMELAFLNHIAIQEIIVDRITMSSAGDIRPHIEYHKVCHAFIFSTIEKQDVEGFRCAETF